MRSRSKLAITLSVATSIIGIVYYATELYLQGKREQREQDGSEIAELKNQIDELQKQAKKKIKTGNCCSELKIDDAEKNEESKDIPPFIFNTQE